LPLAQGWTPAFHSRRPLPIDGKAGWCIVVNECHGLRKDTVRALLGTLERIPDYVVWVFTTNTGQARFFDDDSDGDAAPLVSRCQESRLADGPAVRKARWPSEQRPWPRMPAAMVSQTRCMSSAWKPAAGTCGWSCSVWSRGSLRIRHERS